MDDVPDEPEDYFPTPAPPENPIIILPTSSTNFPLPTRPTPDEAVEDTSEDEGEGTSTGASTPKTPMTEAERAHALYLHTTTTAASAANLEGSRYFRSNDLVQAEALYTKAILIDPSAPMLYTNRAMARLKLGLLEGVLEDCSSSLAIKEKANMKARHYGAQALVGLGRGREALKEAMEAYKIAAKEEAGSLGSVVSVVLKCKKAAWEEREQERLAGTEGVRGKVVEGLRRDLERRVEGAEEGEREGLRKEGEEMIEEVERVWVEAGKAEKKRVVPDWAVDDITFSFMVDPVITKTGKSYERASIMEHLRRSPTDPLTREPLRIDELRPNLALREACEEFLKENGWAVDY
ncbi:hypothetical protein V499_02239 [Pseudogymnoascus sp. VKM F-103]|nr:hypothetical protein V499_02239 [Pseudogymnoascus sp. VKM F-103]